MKKIVSISVAIAASVTMSGAALANNTQTINNSQLYVDPTIAEGFMPSFLSEHCTSVIDGTLGSCRDWGATAAGSAAGTTIVFVDGGTEANRGYFNNPSLMPVLDTNVWANGIRHSGWNNQSPFSSGLMSWDRASGMAYFAGLDISWSGYADAANGRGDIPMGAPLMGGSESLREQWVDQVVVGYIESLDASGNSNLEQNFRNQLSWVSDILPGPDITYAHLDQRLEQGLILDDNGLAFDASWQTMQSVFAVNSNTGATTDPSGVGPGGSGLFGSLRTNPLGFEGTSGLAQLVSQDVQGWLFSCLNCDSSLNAVSHAFTPFENSLTFMPYGNSWRDLPSISHGASGANMTL
jgi:hypothetical protein